MSKIQNADVKGQSDVTADSRLINTDKIYATKTAEVLDDHLRKNNTTTSAPGTGNDNTEDYEVGSRWWDTTADKEYVALDVSTGAAVWTETTGAGGGGSLTVKEEDGTPSVASVTEIRITNGALTDNGGGSVSIDVGDPSGFCVVYNSEPPGTQGGTFTSGAWQTRKINSIDGGSGFCTISSNQFTLQPGDYAVTWQCPAFKVTEHQTQLYDITAATTFKEGSTSRCDAADTVQNESFGGTLVQTGIARTFEIRHRCNTTKTNNGFGHGVNFGINNIYAQVKIIKLS